MPQQREGLENSPTAATAAAAAAAVAVKTSEKKSQS